MKENNIKEFKSADNKIIPYYEIKPSNKTKNSVILVYEIFGMTDHIKNLSNKFANLGFLVNIPDIFSRIEKNVILKYDKEGFNKGIALKEKLGWELPVMDIVGLAALLKKNYKVSIIGFCYGGSLSWLSIQKSFIFDKAVCYYGSSIPEFLNLNINCPTIVHFGNKDVGIPIEAVKKVKDYSITQKKSLKVYEYENADHGFNCEERKSYDKIASDLAFERTINFIKDN